MGCARFIKLSLYLLILIPFDSAFPLVAHQFIFEPVPGDKTGSNQIHTTTVTIPSSYNTSYSREVVLSGIKLKQKSYYQNALTLIAPSTDTTQGIQLQIYTSSLTYKISFFIVFAINGDSLLWMTTVSRTTTIINDYSGIKEDWYENNPATFPVISDISLYVFIKDGIARASSVNVGLRAAVSIFDSAQFFCEVQTSGTSQKIQFISFVVIFINTTKFNEMGYFVQHFNPTFTDSAVISQSSFNIIPNIFQNTVIGGYDGNCILGMQNIQMGGNNYGARGLLFNATNTPVNQIYHDPNSDPFTLASSWLCMGSCPTGQFFDSGSGTCTTCMANCETCSDGSSCSLCNTTYGYDGSACQLCTDLNPACQTCHNASFCLSCVNGSYILTASATCDTCASLIGNCSSCANETHCTACLNDTFAVLSSTFQCEPCSSIIANCLTCSDELTCTSCAGNDIYFVDTGGGNSSCSLCNTAVANCHQCQLNASSVLLCTMCDTGYFYNAANNSCGLPTCQNNQYLDTGTGNCSLCSSAISNCSSCQNGSVCQSCQNDTFAMSSANSSCDLCSSLMASCLTCSSPSVCTLCTNSTFFVDGSGSCSQCSSNKTNCLECSYTSSTLTCTTCDPNYLWNTTSEECELSSCSNSSEHLTLAKTCEPCSNQISNCLECSGSLANSTLACDLCDTTYGTQAGSPACHSCPSLIANCPTCLNETLCISCQNDTFAMSTSNSSCDLCSSLMGNCLTCDSPSSCTSCQNDTYYLDSLNQSCPLCSSALTNCSNCLNSSFCTACEGGASVFLHLNGSCLLCSGQVSSCLECSMLANSSMLCTLCEGTYSWQPSNESCVSCLSLTGDCLSCVNSSYCLTCVNDSFGLTPNNLCEPCDSTMVGCLRCDNVSFCTQCVDDTFYLISTNVVCLKCSYALLNCETCASESVCTSCVSSEFFVDSGNACSLCTDANPGCLNCSTSGNFTCFSCEAAFFLDPGTSSCFSCQASIPNCVNCSSADYCDSCVEGHAFNNTAQCEPCSTVYPNCQSCDNSQCLGCFEEMQLQEGNQLCACIVGWLAGGQCTTIAGCTEPVKYADGSRGCLACNSSDFDPTPADNLCLCKQGTLLQETCNSVLGCLVADGKTACKTCNLVLRFQLNPDSSGQCICEELLETDGTTCVDICGDGFLARRMGDNCDDGNTIGGDGCSENCRVETGYTCRNGSRTAPSQCVYSGIPVTLEQRSTKRNEGQNQGVFKFDVYPPVIDIDRVDLSKQVRFTCDANFTVTGMTYQRGVLTIETEFATDLEGRTCNVSMEFDPSVILSDNFALVFTVESDNNELVISAHLDSYQTMTFLFTAISYTAIAIFALGLGHKMIGAELLVSTQLVYLSSSLYKKIPFLAESVSKLRVVTGYWLFQSEDYEEVLPPFTERVWLSPYFLESTFAVASLVLLVLLFLYVCHVLEYFTEEDEEERRRRRNRRRKGSAWNKVQVALQIIYNFLLVPLTAGFVLVWLLSAYLNNRRLTVSAEGTFSAFLNSAGMLVAWVAIGIVLGVELVFWLRDSNKGEHSLGGLTNCKDWYIPLFLLRCFAVISVLVVSMNQEQVWSAGLILGVLLLYLTFVLLSRPYQSCLDMVGVFFCECSVCYSVALAVLSYFIELPDETWIFIIFILEAWMFTASFLSACRVIMAYKSCIQAHFFREEGLEQEEGTKRKNSDLHQYEDFLEERKREGLNPYSLEAQNLLKRPLRSKQYAADNSAMVNQRNPVRNGSPERLNNSPKQPQKGQNKDWEDEELRLKKQFLRESFKRSKIMMNNKPEEDF